MKGLILVGAASGVMAVSVFEELVGGAKADPTSAACGFCASISSGGGLSRFADDTDLGAAVGCALVGDKRESWN